MIAHFPFVISFMAMPSTIGKTGLESPAHSHDGEFLPLSGRNNSSSSANRETDQERIERRIATLMHGEVAEKSSKPHCCVFFCLFIALSAIPVLGLFAAIAYSNEFGLEKVPHDKTNDVAAGCLIAMALWIVVAFLLGTRVKVASRKDAKKRHIQTDL